MAFTEKEKEDWHAARKAGHFEDERPLSVTCAHCGAPAGLNQAASEFPLCVACDD